MLMTRGVAYYVPPPRPLVSPPPSPMWDMQLTGRACLVQGKGSREQGNLVVKEAVAAMMHKWKSAFRCGTSSQASCRHELP